MVTYSVEVLGWSTYEWRAMLEGQSKGFAIGYVVASRDRENMRVVRSDGHVVLDAGEHEWCRIVQADRDTLTPQGNAVTYRVEADEGAAGWRTIFESESISLAYGAHADQEHLRVVRSDGKIIMRSKDALDLGWV